MSPVVFEDEFKKNALSKKDMRSYFLKQRNNITQEIAEKMAISLISTIKNIEILNTLPSKYDIIAGYFPIRSEIDPFPVMEALHSEGYKIALPRVVDSSLTFHLCSFPIQLENNFEIGDFGIRQPKENLTICDPACFLTPLLAFDRKGNRLGYGKGYYDRVFSQNPEKKRIGLAFSIQEAANIPCEEHDQRLDAIITEKELIMCNNR